MVIYGYYLAERALLRLLAATRRRASMPSSGRGRPASDDRAAYLRRLAAYSPPTRLGASMPREVATEGGPRLRQPRALPGLHVA